MKLSRYEQESILDIIDDVILKQKINVDAVSGATNSSNVIKKQLKMQLVKMILKSV